MFDRLKKISLNLLFQTQRQIWNAELHVRAALSRSKTQSLPFVLFLLALGTLIGFWLHFGLRYSLGQNVQANAAILGDLLVSLGTALAGVSVIAFSLALFLQQGVSDLYSPQYFVAYSFDGKQKAVLMMVVSVVLGQLSYGLYLRALDKTNIPMPELAIPGTIASTALVFSLLWWQYHHVSKKITPSAVIRFLRREANRQFLMFHKRVARAARLSRLLLQDNDDQILATIYAKILPQAQETLLRPIYALSEVTMRMANRGDSVATQQGLQALTAILAEYLKARRASSLVLQSPINSLAAKSDSQELLDRTFEKLNEMGSHFLRADQIDNARFLVDSYATLARAAIQIKFTNQPRENPIAYQLAHYCKGFVNAATRRGDKEIPFRTIETFARLGEDSASRSDAALFYTVAEELASIAIYSANSQVWFISEHCIQAQTRLILAVFQSLGNSTTLFSEVLQRMFLIHQAAVNPQTSASSIAFDRTIVLRKPFDDLQEVVAWIRREVDRISGEQKQILSRKFKSFVEPFYSSLRSVYTKTDLGSVYTDTASELVVQTVKTCVVIEKEFQSMGMDGPIKMFTGLPTWIGHQSETFKSPPGLRHAIDAVCKVTVMLIQEKQATDRVTASLDTQYSIVKRVLQKNTDSHWYYELGLMLRICWCGTVALKYERPEVVEKTVAMVEKFDKAQESKSKDAVELPHLLNEFIGWRNDFLMRRVRTSLGDTAEFVAGLVTWYEANAFIVQAWGLDLE